MHSPTKTLSSCIHARRLLLLLVCAFAKRHAVVTASIVQLTAQQFKEMIDNGSFSAVIDVRRKDEWDVGHIAGATFMENLGLFGSVGQVSTPEDLAGCEYCSIAAYCRSGARAQGALTILRDNGFKGNLYNGQGTSQWESAGYPLVQTDSATPPCTVDMEVADECQEALCETSLADASPCLPPDTSEPGLGAFCFSGRSVVDVKDKGQIAVESLRIGDWVRARDGRFALVYSFGHFQPNANTDYLQILSESMDTKSPLEISAEHLIYVAQHHHRASTQGKKLVPAGTIQIGDFLLTENGSLSPVVSIRTVQRVGAYSPLTESGNLLVNGVLASSYVSRGWVMESTGVSGETLHWLQHGAVTPYRMFCYLSGRCKREHYDRSTGFSAFDQFWYQLEEWQLRQRRWIRTILLFLIFPPTLCFICLGILTESTMSKTMFHLGVALVGFWVWKNADKIQRKNAGERK